ncbi:CHAD domain-containing protein [Oceanospirillum sp.]|uniref:CHAD domain-containing protein n=1 Tax=Oceanospirillum sp. TaxID=2021254 RepID=UPI003A90D3F3
MTAHSRWLIKDSDSTERLLDKYQQKFTLEPMQIRHETLSFYDDFEWHLWHRKQLLASNNKGLILRVDDSGLTFFDGENPPVFAKNLIHPTLKQSIQKLTKGRRLFPMAELEVEFCHYAVRNKDLKKVCDLSVILTGYGTMVELKGLRGYDKEYRRCLNIVLHSKPDELEHHIFLNSLRLLGIKPSSYSARPRIALTPELDSCDAVAIIASTLWKNVRCNEEGIIRDWDTGFLHQYRVALRRLRALFTQMKQSIGRDESQWFKKQLTQIAQTTGRLRDLDVCLESEDYYLSLVPAHFHIGLGKLFRDIAGERQKEQKMLAQRLNSPEYLSQIGLIESRISLCPQSPPRKGHKAILKQASRQIVSRYNAISMDAADITGHSPDEQVHEVRLACKKLRYLLEFFADLFPKEEIRPLLKALKQLQNNLGRFNDLCVQRENLEIYLKGRNTSADTEAAVHALNSALYSKQRQERAHIGLQLEAFLDNDIRLRVESLIPTAVQRKSKTGRLSE